MFPAKFLQAPPGIVVPSACLCAINARCPSAHQPCSRAFRSALALPRPCYHQPPLDGEHRVCQGACATITSYLVPACAALCCLVKTSDNLDACSTLQPGDQLPDVTLYEGQPDYGKAKEVCCYGTRATLLSGDTCHAVLPRATLLSVHVSCCSHLSLACFR